MISTARLRCFFTQVRLLVLILIYNCFTHSLAEEELLAQSLLLEELGEEKSRLLIQELAEQELALSSLVEEGVEWSVSEEDEEEGEEYADG